MSVNTEGIVWINGDLVPESQATVSIFDRGFVYGDAAFDALRTYGHRPLLLDSYLDRFFASLKYMDIDPAVTRVELKRIIDTVLAANLPRISKDEDLQIVMRCTRGSNYVMPSRASGRPTLIVQCPLFRIEADAFDTGVSMITSPRRRLSREALSPKPKTHDRLNNVLADLEVSKIDPKARCLMLDTSGYVAEGSSYNIAAVIDGDLVTPKGNSLEGRTMKKIIEIAQDLGIAARYDDVALYDLYNSPEVFITGSSYVMFPVRSVDGRAIDHPLPGPIQERIWVEWDRMVGFSVRDQGRRFLNAADKATAASVAAGE